MGQIVRVGQMPRSKAATGTKVGTKVKPNNKNKNGRKLCDRGTKCPYQHEYQHNLEYYHEELVTERFPGKVYKLGEAGNTAKRTNNNATSSSSSVFQHSTGRVLGAATTTATASREKQINDRRTKETVSPITPHNAITVGTRNNPIEIKDSQDN